MFIGTEYTALFALVLSLILGMILGVERSLARKGAGMRTFGLVSLGSCFFVLMPALLGMRPGDYDPFRIAAAVITGVGFLGGGIIIYDRELRGLTTAAGLWVSAGIGIAVGFGLYTVALFASFLTLFVFTVMWYVEHFLAERLQMPRLYDDVETITRE
jgi:putative Mg2+ transporter-C (MgtC) family protein